ncbi:MAG: ATP-binding protein [Candidatus Aenigmarchaeota archaeon]|nr:ATP-binding protein [Candidatus Aenigmarchaeota archaeon]
MIDNHNFHWREGFFYNYPKKRDLFFELVKEIESRQIISLTGLRRTGKTTILKQLIDHIIQNAKREHVLFYSFDEDQPKIDEIIHEYENKTGISLFDANYKVYIFLDEIQKLENWQNQIKYYYDNYDNVKFFISGSASLFIKKHIRESLAGRIYEFILNPLSFTEFLVFKGRKEMINKPDLFSTEIEKEFHVYQKRQFIETISESEEKIGQYTKSIIEKIVFQDIPKIFPIENEEILIRILKIIASNPGMLSNYDELAKEIGINRITLSNYFFYLEESFMIKKIYNFSKNRLTSEKKMKKIYLSTASFFSFLNNGIDEPKLIENLLISLINARFFWRTPQKDEVDIVVEKNNEIIPVEIKYRNIISRKDAKPLIKFCENFGIDKAIMITKNYEKEEEIREDKRLIKIIYIPAWKFALNPSRYLGHG